MRIRVKNSSPSPYINATNNHLGGTLSMAKRKKEQEKRDLVQTKSKFKLIGKVTRIDKDGAYKDDTMNKTGHKYDGVDYRSLRFGVKTSETNEITVQMFDFEPEEVFLWNSQKREEDKNYKGEKIPFDEWLDREDELREEGFACLQTRVGLEYGEDGKIVSHGMPSFLAQELIHENLDNGDSVVIEGDISYSSYENQAGKTVEQKNFNIKKAFRLKDVDFESEKFEEVAYFEQEIVFVDADKNTKEKKVNVTGRVIDYKKNYRDVEFVVNYSDGEDGEDEDMKTLANAFVKNFKFGDLLNIFGTVENRVIIEETEEDNSQDKKQKDLISRLGGKKKPKHAQQFQNRTYISEMSIEGVDAWEEKFYSEDDFEEQELVDKKESKKDTKSEFGGKGKRNTNPFEDESDDGDDIDDDELPF
jgi:single-stranded DNA-binding protein